jgi:CubicO group peptidase (beta-lactamase class C family)
MFRPQIRIRSRTQFGPGAEDTTSANDAIALSYGVGWGLQRTPYGWGAFKEGHGDGFQHYLIVYPERKLGVLLMSNSDNAESIFGHLLRLTIADRFTPLEWENYVPYDQAPAGSANDETASAQDVFPGPSWQPPASPDKLRIPEAALLGMVLSARVQ